MRYDGRRSLRVRRLGIWLVAAAGMLVYGGCAAPWRRSPPPVQDEPTMAERERFAQAESRLDSADSTARRNAAVALLSMDHPSALEAVLRSMRDADDPAVRVSMIRAAAFYADHRCFDAVLAAVDDVDVQVQAAAATALSRFTQADEVEAMMALVGGDSTTSRQKQLLFGALGEGLAVRATPVLIRGLEGADEDARVVAWDALRKISRRQLPADAEQWKLWWETNSHRPREEILEEHLEALSRQLADRSRELGDLREQYEEVMALAGSPESETPRKLLEALASRHGAAREFASFRLAALDRDRLAGIRLDDRETFGILRVALEDESPSVRHNVIRFAVQLQGSYQDELIRKALSDESPEVLVMAIEAVGASTGPGAVVRLQDLLENSPHEEVRKAAANMLGKVGSADSVLSLMAALDDRTENVRWFAVDGLRKLSAVQAVPRISEMLEKDGSALVREIAASALGELGQPAGVPALKGALLDRNERVRQKAISALLALATDSHERMALIADAFRRRRLYGPARQVLTRIIDQYADVPDMAASLVKTYEQLAEVLKDDGDVAGAARAYEKLDAMLGGSLKVRRELVNCWLQAEQAPSLVAAAEQWLNAAQAEDAEPLIELVLEAGEQLAGSEQEEEARAVVALADAAVGDDTSHRLKARITRLQRQLGEVAEPPSQ